MSRNDIVKVDGSINYDYLGESIDGLSSQMAEITHIVPLDATTSEIQSILNGNTRILFLDGIYLLTGPLYIKSNQTIIFSPGTIFKISQGSLQNEYDCAINIINQQNVILINALKITMNKEDNSGEWNHALNIQSVKNLKADIINISNTGGDGIYFGSIDNISNNENIYINTIIVDNAKRNGVSFLSGKNIYINTIIVTNTNGTLPGYGIDFEPNVNTNILQNICINNVLTMDNTYGGVLFSLGQLKDSTEPTIITIDNLHSKNEGYMFGIHGALEFVYSNVIDTNQLYGEIKIKNCLIENPNGRGVNFINYSSNCVLITLQNTIILNPCQNESLTSPYDRAGVSMSTVSTDSSEKVGNINFINCKAIDTRAIPLMSVPFYLVSAAKQTNKIKFINCDGENQATTTAGIFQIGSGEYNILIDNPKTQNFSNDTTISNFQGLILTNSTANVITLTLPSTISHPNSIFRFKVSVPNGIIAIKPLGTDKILKNGLSMNQAYVMYNIGDYVKIKATINGWQIIKEITQPVTNIINNPSFIGQIAIYNDMAYIATNMTTNGWKPITS